MALFNFYAATFSTAQNHRQQQTRNLNDILLLTVLLIESNENDNIDISIEDGTGLASI